MGDRDYSYLPSFLMIFEVVMDNEVFFSYLILIFREVVGVDPITNDRMTQMTQLLGTSFSVFKGRCLCDLFAPL